MENFIVQSRWCWEDVKAVKPKWSKRKCENWLYEHQNRLLNWLMEQGWVYIENNLED